MASSNPPPSAPIYFDSSTMIQQNWSLPESIIYYIAKNPTSMAVYQKLIRTCKYFFYKNPIITVASLNYGKKRNYEEDDDSEDEEMDIDDDSGASDSVDSDDDAEMGESEDDDSDLNDDEDMEEDGEFENDNGGNDYFVEDINNEGGTVNVGVNAVKAEEKKKWRACLECDCEKDGCCLEIDDLKTFNRKIWVSSDLEIEGFNEIHTELIPKLASYEFDRLTFDNLEIGFDDFALLSQSATVVALVNVKVTYNDGKIVPLEDILDCMPKLFSFIYDFFADESSISSKTAASFFKNDEFTNAILIAIPEAFDIEAFCGCFDKYRKFMMWFTFSNDISDAYKLKLDAFVDTVINEFPNFGLIINYPGQDMEKRMLLETRYFQL